MPELVMRTRADKYNQWRGLFKCACGQFFEAFIAGVTSGHTKSCGCYHRKRARHANTTHGHTANYKRSPTYYSWRCMLQRCSDPSHKKWKYYGGRGIQVCSRWYDFKNFLADMGERPAGKTLDRINANGNYEPGNCRWATVKEQALNKR